MLKNTSWKTSVTGFLTGAPFAVQALIEAYNQGYFTGKTGWQLAASIGFILFAFFTKDNNDTGGTKVVK